MKATRLAVLGVALAAGLGAAYLMTGQKQPEPQRIVVAPPPPPKPQEAVLVAARDLLTGSVIASSDVRWEPWFKDVPAGVFSRSQRPNAMAEIAGQHVRTPMWAGSPVRQDRLWDTSALMSAELPPGTRAVAIDLADQGRTSAGGFIKPDERVDVIRTFRPDDAAPLSLASETILTNVRVLAIGQTIQEKAGEHTVLGGTATLELTPDQAEKVTLAQRTGQLTLALRALADSANHDPIAEDLRTMTIIRSGNASQARVR